MPLGKRIAFLLAAVTSLTAYEHSALADTGPCHSIKYARAAYAVCEVDLHKHAVRLYWNRSDGTPYAYLSALPHSLEGGAGGLLFATNAGMFDSSLKPVGLYVEQGRELVHANIKSGRGNFHMKPNGIFYISGHGAAVAETQAFLKQRPQAELATQSGPLLVIDGRLHPRSTDAARRSKRALVWAYARMAKSYSQSLRMQCRLTLSHAYSVTR
jgi:uncharacterized protein YigE (DUF2233 family)